MSARLPPRGFSLIELLVVMAIIGMLVGMLLPALTSARERSRTIKCAANLHSIGLALESYATDFHDLYPLAGSTIPWGVTWNGLGQHPGWMEQLSGHFTDNLGYQCPSYPKLYDSEYDYFLGVRAAFIANGTMSCVNRSLIRFPSCLILSGDNNYNQFDPLDCDKDDYTQECLGFVVDSEHWTPQHSGGLNVLFADSHVFIFQAPDLGRMTYRYDSMSPW